jgi:hypothetical protein
MSLELLLLLLESVLLIVTLVLLGYSIHEGRRRDHLIQEVASASRIFTRQEYFRSIMDAMYNAQHEIIGCITGRAPRGEESALTRDITRAIEKMTGKGVRVRYLLPKFPDRLQIGLQYALAGAEVSFSSCLMVHNLRYTVVDDRIVVLGIPEIISDKEATKKGYSIPSEGLAGVLKNYFSTCELSSGIKDYIHDVLKQSGATPEHLAQELKTDVKTLSKFMV